MNVSELSRGSRGGGGGGGARQKLGRRGGPPWRGRGPQKTGRQAKQLFLLKNLSLKEGRAQER